MAYLLFTILCLSALFGVVQGLSPTYSTCQFRKPAGESPLTGCPNGTLYVSTTDSSADFHSIQRAIDSLSETGDAFILIAQGSYNEMLNVTRISPLTLLGQLDPATAELSEGNATQRNLVDIWNNRRSGQGWSDEETATLTVAAPMSHSFGNTNFRVYNINFENRAVGVDGNLANTSPALAVSLTLSNSSFYGCTFKSIQDTWYTGCQANSYAAGCEIYGKTDYLFGLGRAWFQGVTLGSRGCGGGITAWAGTSEATNGVYVADSSIIRAPDATEPTTGACYLGRPWNKDAVAVFLRNYMDESINSAGFTPWSGEATIPTTTFFAEYDSRGPGGNTSARVLQDHILNSNEAQQFTLEHVFSETPSWIDFSYQY